MITIKVLGSGCTNCNRLERLARLALEEVRAEDPSVEAVIEKVTDYERFMDYGLMVTPGLVINEKLVSAGRLPAPKIIAGWIREALNEN